MTAGEAVLWPADVVHAAWTDHLEMRAIVVEFAGADDAAARASVIEGAARRLEPGAGAGTARTGAPDAGAAGAVARGEGRLAERPVDPDRQDRTSGEPL